jgi:uncharacterized protein with HEPN domain
MSRNDVIIRYHHMLDNALRAQELAHNIKESDLDTDWVRTYALVRALEVIGEAAGHIPADEQMQHPEIPWAQIVGLRNRLIHGYDSVDLSILWRILHDDLPSLIEALKSIISP